MSFPRYPNYKDSGVEWLGEVPEHWDVRRLRFAATLNPSKSEVSGLDRQTAVSFLPMEAIGDGGTLNLESERAIGAVEAGYTYFRDGDVTFAKITPCFENGKGALMRGLTNGVGFGTTELIVARPRPGRISGAYLHYLFISRDFRELGEAHMYGAGGQKRVPDAFARNFATAFPPLSEQTLVTSFLDRETAKIDQLVEEQRRLIALLQEKRQSVISHAVTKGLNPDAPTKPSGVEWLGHLPSDWSIGRLKHVSPAITVGIVVNPSTFIAEEGLPFIYGGDIREGAIDLAECRRISAEASDANEKTRLRGGDLLTVRVGAPGVTAVVPAECEGGNCASVMLIRKGAFNSQWLCYTMNSRAVRYQVEVVQYGAAQEQFNISHAVDFILPLPTRIQQNEIAAYLDDQVRMLDTLMSESQHAIDLLLERRSALISAAVTGQIDVRSVVAA